MPKVTTTTVLNLQSYAYKIPGKRTRKQSQRSKLEAQQSELDEPESTATNAIHNVDEDTPIPRDPDSPISSDANPIVFPLHSHERGRYRTKTGKKLTQYQWDVYDFIFKIPMGKVVTYKIVADAVGGSPRSAGNALRTNPFAPYIPCHRVIASNMFIGGFCGQWAGRKKGEKEESEQFEIKKKIALLEQEGISLDSRGYLKGGQTVIWRNSNE